MVRKIREDLTGRVLTHSGGTPVWLVAGDAVPKGVQVAESLLQPVDKPAERTAAKRGGRSASSNK